MAVRCDWSSMFALLKWIARKADTISPNFFKSASTPVVVGDQYATSMSLCARKRDREAFECLWMLSQPHIIWIKLSILFKYLKVFISFIQWALLVCMCVCVCDQSIQLYVVWCAFSNAFIESDPSTQPAFFHFFDHSKTFLLPPSKFVQRVRAMPGLSISHLIRWMKNGD